MVKEHGIEIDHLPELDAPWLIAGFNGWGNALDVSNGMAGYLARQMQAAPFARIDPDEYYRYDGARPHIKIDAGSLKRLKPPGGNFYAVKGPGEERDLVILQADEPNLRWYGFTAALLSLCRQMGATHIITLGSMLDNVLHTDRLISAMASDDALSNRLKRHDVLPIYYEGPTAIHSVIQSEGVRAGLACISLWCHCPFYLENITHHGMLIALGELLADLAGFTFHSDGLQREWQKVAEKIQQLIDENPKVQEMIQDLRKSKLTRNRTEIKGTSEGGNVINLQDFLDPD